jgi:hypothetical protein
MVLLRSREDCFEVYLTGSIPLAAISRIPVNGTRGPLGRLEELFAMHLLETPAVHLLETAVERVPVARAPLQEKTVARAYLKGKIVAMVPLEK